MQAALKKIIFIIIVVFSLSLSRKKLYVMLPTLSFLLIDRPPSTVTPRDSLTTGISPMTVGQPIITTLMKMKSTDTPPATVTNDTPLYNSTS